jgi:hypothetical protein
MRYFMLKGEKTIFKAEDNVANLYLRNGFTEVDETGKPVPEKEPDGGEADGGDPDTR